MEFTPQAKRAFHMQSYGPGPSIDGVELVELKRFADDAGTLTELARLSDGRAAAFAGFALRQINYSELSPGRSRRSTCTRARPTSGTCLRATACSSSSS